MASTRGPYSTTDRVDARRLLEELQREHDGQHAADAGLGGHLLPGAAAAPAAAADDVLDLQQPLLGLGGRVRGLVEYGLGLGVPALHGEPPRRLRHGEHAGRQEHRGHHRHREHDPPRQVHG